MALFLAVFVSVATVGAVGVFRYVDSYWLYRGFPQPVVPRTVIAPPRVLPDGVVLPAHVVAVRRGRVMVIDVRSEAIGGLSMPVIVYLPPGYASGDRRYPVLYLLHGFPGRPAAFLQVGGIVRDAEVLQAEGRIRPMILVMPTGTTGVFADEEWANGISPGNDWETYLARDVVSAIQQRFRTIPTRAGRGIAGYSEGGYGSLNIGLHHPGEFGLMESWSGYEIADDVPSAFGSSEALRAENSPSLTLERVGPLLLRLGTYVWMYDGSLDTRTTVAENRVFAAELRRFGVRSRYFEPRATHTWRLWREEMSNSLVAASEHLSHA